MKYFTNVSCYGNKIFHRYIENGKRYCEKIDFEPTLFYPTNKQTKFESLDGHGLYPKKYNNIKDMKNAIYNSQEIEFLNVYGMKNPVYQFISEHYSDINFETDMISEIRGVYIDIEVHSDKGFPKPDKAEFPIVAITLYDSKSEIFYVLGYHKDQTFKFDHNHEKIGDLKVVYKHCVNEFELLSNFIRLWEIINPDWVTGWNTSGFDLPYLYNRIISILGERSIKRLSPFGVVSIKEIKKGYQRSLKVDIKGVADLDYLEVYLSQPIPKLPSYKLDYVAHHELKENKLSYEESGNLRNLYEQNFQRYIEYNIQDTNLIKRLEEKLKFIEVAYVVSYYAKVNYVDTLKTVPVWESLIYNHLLKDNIIPIIKKISSKKEQYAGAYVQEPNTGFYNWVVSIDLASMYPHIMQQFNIGPDTIIDPYNNAELYINMPEITEDGLLNKYIDTKFINKNNCLSVNGILFSKQKKSFFHVLMQELYEGRKKDKTLMNEYKKKLVEATDEKLKKEYKRKVIQLNGLQMAKKILMNSGYGACGSAYFNYFDVRIAEAITGGGRLAIRWIAKHINEYFNNIMKTNDFEYVCYIDTDSNYINCEKIVDKFCKNKSTNEIIDFLSEFFDGPVSKFITKSFEELSDYLNCYENKMFMDREVISEKAIWAGKKRYAMAVWDMEGIRFKDPVSDGAFKVLGLDAVKSTIPDNCRSALLECYKICLTSDNKALADYINKFKAQYMSWDVEEISISSSINNLKKYSDDNKIYIKGTPYHVKGALIYNKLLKDKNLTDVFESIHEGDHGKIIHLVKKNPLGGETVISYPTFLPKELGLHQYVDKNEMFNKAFLEPLDNLITHINWSNKNTIDIEDVF